MCVRECEIVLPYSAQHLNSNSCKYYQSKCVYVLVILGE